ncbi:hypothetical protein BsWGS_06701 [Bradybaena similaris]
MKAAHTVRLLLILTGMALQDYVLCLDKSNEFDQHSIKSCPLMPKMDINMCYLDGLEIQRAGGSKENVPEGTACMLGAEGQGLVLTCVERAWVETAEHKWSGLGFSRRKRLAGAGTVISWSIPPLINKTSCVFMCDGRNANNPPSITCPKIPSVIYADKAESSKKVTWSRAVAHDKENSDLSTHVTSGWVPGSVLTDGSYYVTYFTKDRGGKTDTCTRYFSVKARRCPSDRTFLENGQATCSAYTLYGSRCTYICNPGYELNGPTFSDCLRNSAWRNNKPTCKEVSCGPPPSIPRGNLSCTDHTYTSTCGVTCTDVGYSLQGPSNITCQRNKTWTQPGVCVDIKPPVIHCSETLTAYAQPHLTHSTVDWKLPNASDNSGQFVNVTSQPKPGFNFTLGVHKVEFTAIDSSGLKSVCYMHLLLKERQCDASVSIPDFANVTCSKSNAVGSECSAVCHHGYILEGDAKRTCQENGMWSGEPAKCKPKPCPKPPVVVNGHYDCPDGHEFQDICLLICNDGFKAESSFVITCQINSSWTSAGVCFDVESPVFPYGCPADMKTHAGPMGLPTSVIYDYPVVTENSGANVTITAKPESGSEFSIGTTEITITAIDSTRHSATCQFHVIVEDISCEKPNFDSTGKLVVYDCPDNFVYGANCSLTCSDGNPVQGSSLITCDKMGEDKKISWRWSGDVAPYCKSEVCPKLNTPQNGSLVCTNIFGGKDQQCIVECHDQYMYPKSAPEMFMCLESVGEWSHEGLVPDCIERRKPKKLLAKLSFHYLASSCDDQNIEIKNKLTAALKESLKHVCTRNQKCDVNEVIISCKGHTVDTNNIEYEILVQMDLGDYQDHGSPSETMEHYDLVLERINHALIRSNDRGIFNIPYIGTFDSFYYAYPVFTCDAGEILVFSTLSCSGCGEGNMLDSSTDSCVPCPVGTYQSDETSTSCTQCPDGTSTANTQSVSEDQCLLFCNPGEASSTGMVPCSPCKRGSYQENIGMTDCRLCPFGMSTSSEGSSSSFDCLFYNVQMGKDTPPAIIQLSDPKPESFTLLMWVHPVSSSIKEALEFSLESNQTNAGSASFSLGNVKLFVTPINSGKLSSIRRWYHVALVYVNGTTILYVSGNEVMRSETLPMAEFKNKEFTFSQSDLFKYIVISGVQMTSSGLGENEVQEFSRSCNRQATLNLLGVNQIDTTLVTPSTCDDVNDCADNPCGEFGTCIDEAGTYACVCDNPWSGDRCHVVPDYCLHQHRCAEGSTCVNDPRNKTYICTCPPGYGGRLCHDKIVNGNWGLWEEWGPCSVVCGSGLRSRTRECNNPKPNIVGEYCPGEGTESQKCEEKACPVDGQWSEWSLWSYSATCGKVTASRQRTCSNPVPSLGGIPCLGPEIEYQISEKEICPVHGQFGLWSEWSQCSATCGGGASSRRRACDSPPPANGGFQCNSSQAVETKLCSVHSCPKCKVLNTTDIAESFSCAYHEADDMTICSITCKPGMVMVPNDLNEFKCGRLTNYTWSHQTKENPTGILPKCADTKIPSSQKTVLNVQFDKINCNEPPVSEFKNSINYNLEQTINCKNIGDCSREIQTTLSCGKQTRSTGSLLAVITMAVSQAGKHSEYLSILSEREIIVEMNRQRMIESMAIQLMNQSSEIYEVIVHGVIYNGEIKSAKAELECPQDGSGFLEGVCVDCPSGSYSNGNGSCVQCGKGFYQDQARMKSCVQCPKGLTTSGIGASLKEDCKADQPDYMDYFDWLYDDIHENMDEHKDGGQFKINDTLIIGVIAVVTLFLVVLFTYTTIYLVRIQKRKLHINKDSMQNTYFNEMYETRTKLQTDSEEKLDTKIYYEIGPEFEKEVKEMKSF